MVADYLQLRDRLHGDEFHLDIGAELWQASYLDRPGVGEHNVIRIVEDGELRGYAVCFIGEEKGVKSLQVLEFVAQNQEVMMELLARAEAKAKQNDVDLISLTCFDEPSGDLLTDSGFTDFPGVAVMVALINPLKLLKALSVGEVKGKGLNLEIASFEPLSLIVGDNQIRVAEQYNPEAVITLSLSDKVFFDLMFGKTSFWKELISGNLKVKGKARLGVAVRFFAIIRQKRLYIPPGDGI